MAAHTPEQDAFYKTQAWRDCRDSYAKSVGGLCERCLSKGIIRAGVIVHHKVHLNSANLHDPAVSLNWDNLELLCRDCHAEMHKTAQRRYRVDANGNVTARK